VTLGVFLLLALRSPAAHRSLIAFTAWSSLVHGATMGVQAWRNDLARVDLVRAVIPLAVIGLVLISQAKKDRGGGFVNTKAESPNRVLSP